MLTERQKARRKIKLTDGKNDKNVLIDLTMMLTFAICLLVGDTGTVEIMNEMDKQQQQQQQAHNEAMHDATN